MGQLSRKHQKNRGERYERRKRHQFARHLAMHRRRGMRPHGDSPWSMTPDSLARLAAYNAAHATA